LRPARLVSMRPYPKRNKAKRLGMTQGIQHLPSKLQALSTDKKKSKEVVLQVYPFLGFGYECPSSGVEGLVPSRLCY
jgi:hypothetical protein